MPDTLHTFFKLTKPKRVSVEISMEMKALVSKYFA